MDLHRNIITKNAAETEKIGEVLAHHLISQHNRELFPHLYCLYGDLGSGKTTFTRGFARGLGIKDRIISPTYIFIRSYKIPESRSNFYHIDLYRTGNGNIVKSLGLSEIISGKGNVIMIEWADLLQTDFGGDRTDIKFTTQPDNAYEIRIIIKK